MAKVTKQAFLREVQGKTYQIEKQLPNGNWVTYGQLVFEAK